MSMANLIHRPGWFLPERCVTPEGAFRNRRDFLKQLGLAGGGLLAATLVGCNKSALSSSSAANSPGAPQEDGPIVPVKDYPAQRNAEFSPGWRLTNEKDASTYNNFYEFSLAKDAFRYVGKFVTSPSASLTRATA